MAYQRRVRAAAQNLVQGHRVGGQRAEVIGAVVWNRGRRIPAHEGGHGMERGGQGGQQASQVCAVSGNPWRHSASGPDPASSSPNSSPLAVTVPART